MCDKPLWSKLHRAFGVETFEPVYRNLIDTDSELARPALFCILDALVNRKDGMSWARTIAAKLTRLAPVEAPPAYGRKRWDPKSVGDPGETRILLAASHLLESADDRIAARAFLQADSSLPYLRKILVPVLLEKPLHKFLE